MANVFRREACPAARLTWLFLSPSRLATKATSALLASRTRSASSSSIRVASAAPAGRLAGSNARSGISASSMVLDQVKSTAAPTPTIWIERGVQPGVYDVDPKKYFL